MGRSALSERPPGNRWPFCFPGPLFHTLDGPQRRNHDTEIDEMKTQEDLERRTDTTTPSSEEPGTKGKGTTMLAPLSEEEFSPEWWDEALCRDGEGGLTKVFFSEELQDIARAKTICAECPAMLTCLEGAIARREPWGVWGGQMFLNGKILATKRRRGRPPKNPRPEDQLPEIPVPLHLQGYLRSA